MNLRFNIAKFSEIESKQHEINKFYNDYITITKTDTNYKIYRSLGSDGRRFYLSISMYGPYKSEVLIPHHLIGIVSIPHKLYKI